MVAVATLLIGTGTAFTKASGAVRPAVMEVNLPLFDICPPRESAVTGIQSLVCIQPRDLRPSLLKVALIAPKIPSELGISCDKNPEGVALCQPRVERCERQRNIAQPWVRIETRIKTPKGWP